MIAVRMAHLAGMIIWVASLSVQVATLYSNEPRLSALRHKVWLVGVLPGASLFTIGAIALVVTDELNPVDEGWLLAKIGSLGLIIVGDALVQIRSRDIADGTRGVTAAFGVGVTALLLAGVLGGMGSVMWHEADESRAAPASTDGNRGAPRLDRAFGPTVHT